MARALYAEADIYLFDDPISAVDSKVARRIFDNVILEMSDEKTVLLVTHQISYLYECDQVLIMEDGKITHNDSAENLKENLTEIENAYKDEEE